MTFIWCMLNICSFSLYIHVCTKPCKQENTKNTFMLKGAGFSLKFKIMKYSLLYLYIKILITIV